MKKLSIIAAVTCTCLIAVVACTSTNVKQVESNKHQIQLVCIEENPKVIVAGFLNVVEEGFMRHGIETEVYKDRGNMPAHCEYILTYTALRSWDVAAYLAYAELKLKYDQKIIGSATYRHRGGLALNKWRSTETKMTPVIDELLSEF